MRKNFLYSLLILPLPLNCQNNFMALSFGGNLPMQNFARHSNITSHGFALTGFTGDYSGAFFTKNNLGVGGNIRYASNSVDENSIVDILSEEFPLDFPLSDPPAFAPGFWKYISILAGPEYTLSGERMNFDLFALLGINFVLPPEMNVHAENSDDSYDQRLELRTVNLGMEAGCSFRYHLSAYSSLRIHLGWFVSTCTGDIVKEMDVAGDRTEDQIKYSCTIHTLNSGIGIVYRL